VKLTQVGLLIDARCTQLSQGYTGWKFTRFLPDVERIIAMWA